MSHESLPRGVILAAGAGTRFGIPKALARWGDQSFLERLVALYRALNLGVVVVLGAEAEKAHKLVPEADDLKVVANEHWQRGQTSSLQCGLAALPASCPGFFIHPVDFLYTEVDDLERMLVAWRASNSQESLIVRPVCGGEYGHPVLYGRGYLGAFLALSAQDSGRVVYRRFLDQVQRVETPNSRIARDVDRPGDLDPS